MSIIYTSQFKKDYKRIQRQSKKIDELRTVIEKPHRRYFPFVSPEKK